MASGGPGQNQEPQIASMSLLWGQRPKPLGSLLLLSQGHYRGAGLEVEPVDLSWRKWDASILVDGLIYYSAILTPLVTFSITKME